MSPLTRRPSAPEAETRSTPRSSLSTTGKNPTDGARTGATAVTPPGLDEPRGFSHGWLAPVGAQILFVAGQTAADPDGRVADSGFGAQFDTALSRALAVVASAGGQPEHVLRITVYVTDMDAYRRSREVLGEVWRRRMGRHYPAMALVEVSRLVDVDAVVEIEVTAAVPASVQDPRG